MSNYQTIHTTDCCGSYCENDTDICPNCYEHCEVVTKTFDLDPIPDPLPYVEPVDGQPW